MQVSETLNEGLKREIKIVVPKADLQTKLGERLEQAKGRAQIQGFRPGKGPVQHLRKMYGKSFMAEIVNEILNETPRSLLAERGEKSATQPEIDMTEDEKEAEKVLAGEADFEFSMKYEIIPPIEIKDFSSIAITRPVVEIPESEVDEQVKRIAQSTATYETKSGKAASGDRVTMDYVGKIDGEAFEGGSDTDANLVLGSGQFIPGFEDQLIGAKAGDSLQVKVTFPENYGAAHLAGKDAVFDVTVKDVASAGEVVIDDEMAKKIGLESAESLRKVVRDQIEGQYGSVTRQKVKRQLLDALDEAYKFDTPSKLVDAEFNNIWAQITHDLEQAGKTFEDEETTEEEARAEYLRLAERRVRLGLVLSEIGEKAGVTVTEQELQQSVMNHVRQYPGQEQEVFNFFKNNPDAVANLRAPIFEEKTVDHLLEQVSVTDKPVSKEELMAEDEEEAKEAAPAKKKAAPKKAAADKDEKAEPAKKAAPKKKKAEEAGE